MSNALGYVEDEIQGTGDKEGLFTGTKYQKRSEVAMVVADGAHVVDVGSGTAVDITQLVEYIQSEDGPGVRRNCELCQWHWADTEASKSALDSLGVDKHFKLHLFKSIDGRQPGAVDAKIQSLIRRFLTVSTRSGTRKVSLVLLASDGDHSANLWAGVKELLKKKVKVVIWVIGWDASSVSRKLRVPPKEVLTDNKEYLKIECRYFSRRGFCELKNISLSDRRLEGIPSHVPQLSDFVKEVFPRVDCPTYERLLRNSGLHRLLAATWYAHDVPGEGMTYQSRVLIVSGKTGSGKSTQLPQFLYDQLCYKRWKTSVHGKPFQRPRVLCTQPRRIACTRITEFVRQERHSRHFPWDSNPHDVVGYHIGGVKDVSDNAGVVYCTAGVLLKQLLHSKDEHWDVIMLDEIHERSVEYDLLLALLLRKDYLDSGKLVVIMSATLGTIAEEFLKYAVKRCSWLDKRCFTRFDITEEAEVADNQEVFPAPLVHFEGYPPVERTTQYNVDVFFLDDVIGDFKKYSTHSDRSMVLDKTTVWPKEREWFVKDFLLSKVCKGVKEDTNDTILVFCPGVSLIYDIYKFIEWKNIDGVRISVLYSRLSDEEQAAALTRSDTDRVRIILSTDLAESSLTIEDVTIVVDLCLRKEACAIGRSHKRLDYIRTPLDTCTQRKGRVGRVNHGQCYFMISKNEYDRMERARIPEIMRQNLELIVLNVLSKISPDGNANPLQLIRECLTAPPERKINTAIAELERIHALAPTPSGIPKLETFGKMLHHMPCDIDVARFIIWCSLVNHNLGKLAVIFAAMLESGVLQDTASMSDDANSAWDGLCTRAVIRKKAADGYPSDVIVLINLFLEYSNKAGKDFVKYDTVDRWCRRRGMDPKIMLNVKRRIAQLRHELHKYRPLMPELPAEALGTVQGGNHVIRLTELLSALDKEHKEMKGIDCAMLMFLHAGCFVSNAVQCELTKKATDLPRRTMEVRLSSKDARREDRDHVEDNKRRVLSALFRSKGSPVSGDVRMQPEKKNKFQTVTAHIKVFKLERSESGDREKFPLSLYLAAQIDSRCVKNMFSNSTNVFVTIPHYSHDLCDDTKGTRNRLQTTVLRPLLLPESHVTDEPFYIFPTDVEDHESIIERDRYTRMNSYVTALPNTIASSVDGVPLWKIVQWVFMPVQQVEKPKIDRAVAENMLALRDGLSFATIVNTDKYLSQVEDEVDDAMLEDADDEFLVPKRADPSIRTTSINTPSHTSTELHKQLTELLQYIAAPTYEAPEDMFRVIA